MSRLLARSAVSLIRNRRGIVWTTARAVTGVIETLPGVSNKGGVKIVGAALKNGTTKQIFHLPKADDPVGAQLYKKAVYCPHTRILRTSAHVGTQDDNTKADGVVGDDIDPETARNHARNSGLRLLATMHEYLGGDFDRIEQVLHLKGMVKATPEFTGHASVIDGCSEVLAEALGHDAGIGTRECFGVASLGATVACTIEVRLWKRYDSGTQLVIRNIPLDYDWRDLTNHFKPYGEIILTTIPKSGMGFVRFARLGDAQKAAETMNGSDVQGCKIDVQIDKKKTLQPRKSSLGWTLNPRKFESGWN